MKNRKRIFGIYHSSDLDGWASASIMKHAHPHIELIPWDYGWPIPDIPEGSDLIMCDISFPPKDMEDLANLTEHMIWIDHHISAINDIIDYFGKDKIPFNCVIPDVIDGNTKKIAACELAWGFFVGTELPLGIKLLGWYDTFRDKEQSEWDDTVIPFQLYMQSVCNSPNTFPVELLETDDGIEKMVEIGQYIYKYQDQKHKNLAEQGIFETEIEGYKAVACNTSELGSKVFDYSYKSNIHHLMVPFKFVDGVWKFSLYSENPNVDCSAIAKRYGGGGHRGAAGFQLTGWDAPNKILFKFKFIDNKQ